MDQEINTTTSLAIFKGKEIRKTLHNNEWWFSVVDAVAALTDSINPRDYWFKMKIRVRAEDGIELSTICRQLKLISSDGKKYETDCADTEGIFRIIQAIPSPKAEPNRDFPLTGLTPLPTKTDYLSQDNKRRSRLSAYTKEYWVDFTRQVTGLTSGFIFDILELAKTTRSDPFGHGGF